MKFPIPEPREVAGAAALALLYLVAALGVASFFYGFWIFWKPGAFLCAGALLFVFGFFGALGHSAGEPDEDR